MSDSLPNNLQTAEQIATILQGDIALHDNVVRLNVNQYIINLRSNSSELLDWCRYYLAHILETDEQKTSTADIEIIAIERPALQLAVDFKDWIREDHKKARKDAIYDVPGARLLHKVRTGMMFLQSSSKLIAAGECLHNKNQVINFINAQYMTYLQNQKAVICHAAGLVFKSPTGDQALGMAGFSGGGKSTLMLHMLDQKNTRFLSNDRLFLQQSTDSILAIGIPKLPRVNPGTIINNPKLENLISAQRREELQQLPPQELWNLEQKYDVMVDESYGPDKIQYQAEIKRFVVLNWQHDSQQAVQLKPVDLGQRKDLLAAIMKSPGPFYQYENGELYQYENAMDEQAYLDVFAPITVYEASGQVDFQVLSKLCAQLMSA